MRRNALANVAGRGLSALLWVGVTPAVLAAFGTERFAVWALYLALGGALVILDFGVGNSVVRYVARADARGDRAAAGHVVRRLLPPAAALGAAWALALLLGRELFVRAFHVPAELVAEVRASLPWFAGASFVAALAPVFQAALMGLQRLELSNACFLSGLVVHVALLLAGLHGAQPLVGAAMAMLSGNLVAAVLGAAFTRGLVAGPRPAGAQPRMREMLGFGVTVQATNAFALGQLQVGKYLLGLLDRLAWITPFELGFRVANAIWSLPVLIQGAVIPAAAHALESRGIAAVSEVYRWASRWVLAATGAVMGGLWLGGPALVTLWLGPGHEAPGRMARDLALALALGSLAGPAGAVARGAGWASWEAITVAVTFALNGVLTFVLLPALGASALVWGLGISYGVAGLGLLFVLHRRLGVANGAWLRDQVLVRLAVPFALAFGLDRLSGGMLPRDRAGALALLLPWAGAYLAGLGALGALDGDLAAVLGRLRARRVTAEGKEGA